MFVACAPWTSLQLAHSNILSRHTHTLIAYLYWSKVWTNYTKTLCTRLGEGKTLHCVRFQHNFLCLLTFALGIYTSSNVTSVYQAQAWKFCFPENKLLCWKMQFYSQIDVSVQYRNSGIITAKLGTDIFQRYGVHLLCLLCREFQAYIAAHLPPLAVREEK